MFGYPATQPGFAARAQAICGLAECPSAFRGAHGTVERRQVDWESAGWSKRQAMYCEGDGLYPSESDGRTLPSSVEDNGAADHMAGNDVGNCGARAQSAELTEIGALEAHRLDGAFRSVNVCLLVCGCTA